MSQTQAEVWVAVALVGAFVSFGVAPIDRVAAAQDGGRDAGGVLGEPIAATSDGGTQAVEEASVEVGEAPPKQRAATRSARTRDERPDPLLAATLARAAEYVSTYEGTLRDLVAEEEYVQSSMVYSWRPFLSEVTYAKQTQRQRTRADLVFVQLAGGVPWGLFRDVFELNGKPLRPRDSRLVDLLRDPSPSHLDQARRILRESAEFNIGSAARTLNFPTLPLAFLLERNQGRFTFVSRGRSKIGGVKALEVGLEEVQIPTLVTDSTSQGLPASGRFWMSVDAGTVLKSEVCFRFEPDRATGTITVAYRSHRGLGLWLPSEMKEKYEDVGGTTRPVFGGATKATARYSNYRRFTVEVVEKAEW